MKTSIALLIGVSVVLAQPVVAAMKDCEELKTEIAAKLDAKGVKDCTLTVVPAAEIKADAKVVGSCEGGSKRIVYTKG
ncbi:MAG: DUF1161 domain-containing protein [Gammaproteobacteria bacterium]|nr:DUF1161 domain-containing protein [Gammaproteobacteria bacterium]